MDARQHPINNQERRGTALNNGLIRICPFVAAMILALPLALHAQKPVPVPALNLKQLTGTWFQVQRLPDKAEKGCVSDGITLFALGEKDRAFQRGHFCRNKKGDLVNGNKTGKQDKKLNGDLRISRFVIFHTHVYVLAAAPDMSYALLGKPNHKSLWLLSRTATLQPAAQTQLTSQAAAMGYKTDKLLTVPHTGDTYRVVNGQAAGTAPAAHLPTGPQPPSQ